MNSPHNRPASPCIARCSTALGDDICHGCGRTFVEVANWVAMSDDEREVVWQRLEQEGWWPLKTENATGAP